MNFKAANNPKVRLKVAALVLAMSGIAVVQQAAWSAKEAESAGGPAVTRRLTESQYRATVADIFAPDIPVVGRFERELRVEGLIAIGTSEAGLSAFSVEQYDASARGIAAAVVSKERRDKLVPCQPSSETEFDKACAQKFVEHYGPLLFRRPLASQETKRYVETARVAQEKLGNFYRGLEFSLAGMMVQPDFLLRIERVEADPKRSGQTRLDSYSKAARLSYFLTNSTPDKELLRAAGAGELNTEQGRAKQVDRLMATPRFEGAVRAFFEDMLHFELFEDLAKDPVIYPAYSSVVAADAQEQTLRTITDHLVTKKGDYRDLFTTRQTFLTRSLGRLYKLPVATRNGFESVELPADSGHSGILTNVSFVALHSHPGRSSPTLRGKAIREIFMCQKVPDPPPDVDFSAVDLTAANPDKPTARIRLDAHRSQPACAGCHSLMDPIGLTLENFDGAGSFRTHENNAVIDVSGTLDGSDFVTAQGLGKALHDSPLTTMCLVDKMYRSGVGRNLADAEQRQVVELIKIFEANGYRVPDLMRAIAVSSTFYAASAPSDKEGATTDRADTQQRTGDKS
jgi:Protein of unknown function (DUF1592)/Protein of unknown function (DUF1588)/Protein of unknown function (DUF1595)/Protein of unknown function (DUF1585)/Protein of unknown function (DUF1587)